MAKESMKAREVKRAKLAKRYQHKRDEIAALSLIHILNTLQHATAVNKYLLYTKFGIFQTFSLVLGLPVGDGRLEELLQLSHTHRKQGEL